jgi:hypothetical protein
MRFFTYIWNKDTDKRHPGYGINTDTGVGSGWYYVAFYDDGSFVSGGHETKVPLPSTVIYIDTIPSRARERLVQTIFTSR